MRMKGFRHIGFLLTSIFAVISCEREDIARCPIQETGRPIEFAVENDWPEITKSLINSTEDIKEEGFRAWGVKTPDYGESFVFGDDGTGVYYKEGKWRSEVVKDWQIANYSFAAILPPSEFDGRYSEKTLTLDLGEAGFSLADNQKDLMYAFCDVDNTKNEAKSVDFVFNHAFSSLDIRLKRNGAFVTKVMLYGIHNKIQGELEFFYTSEGISTNLKEILADKTTQDSPYYLKSYSEVGQGFNYSTDEISIIKDLYSPEPLLVFPEDLSFTPLKIVVGLFYQGKSIELSAEINTGEWSPGLSYVYVLEFNNNNI